MGIRSKKRKLKEKLANKSFALAKSKQFKNPPHYKNNFGNIVAPIELVFPIVRKNEDNSFDAVGTGFFIHPAGGFATAKHLIPNLNDPNCPTYFGIHTYAPGKHEMRKILYFEPHPISDVGIGMLKGSLVNTFTHEIVLHTTFPISLSPPRIGDNIYTLAYPRMKISSDGVGLFQCDLYDGQVIDHRIKGSGILQSEVFITNMLIKSGASGGPVLRKSQIIGVNSSSMNITPDQDPISFITPISHVFDLTLKDSVGKTTTVQELMNNGHMPFAL